MKEHLTQPAPADIVKNKKDDDDDERGEDDSDDDTLDEVTNRFEESEVRFLQWSTNSNA
jgi:hypothetical protein